MITETVYLGRDNVNKITITSNGSAVDFSSATRFVLSFENSAVTADTDVTSGIITGTSAGVVTMALSDIALSGFFEGVLTVYDAVNTDGLRVTEPGKLFFDFV